MQIAHHLRELRKNKKESFLWNTAYYHYQRTATGMDGHLVHSGIQPRQPCTDRWPCWLSVSRKSSMQRQWWQRTLWVTAAGQDRRWIQLQTSSVHATSADLQLQQSIQQPVWVTGFRHFYQQKLQHFREQERFFSQENFFRARQCLNIKTVLQCTKSYRKAYVAPSILKFISPLYSLSKCYTSATVLQVSLFWASLQSSLPINSSAIQDFYFPGHLGA